MKTALIIHGHFYQPPRENPWTEIVDREPSARPFHDWNERIHKECYRPNGFARIIDAYGRIELIVNNYVNLSFNFGPTLLSWLEREHAETYARILEADRESREKRNGHGNAIAQSYNHTILPLSNERDRRTQVRWGLRDFAYRFKRDAEALWLPETACDDRTLGVLIDEGLRYVILSPHQAERVRPIGEGQWLSVNDGSIDTTLPYKYLHTDGSGRSIAVFFYDGPIARAIAFDGALASSQGLVDRFERAATAAARGAGRCVNVATDGETYGHHFHWGDRTLAYALEVEARARGLWVTNYGEFLDHSAPTMEVEIKRGPDGEGTSWSCAHGVGRWKRDCGCQTGAQEGWNQKWRTPLREALDFLRDEGARAFEATTGDLFVDPWAARDHYIELIVDSSKQAREDFLRRHAGRQLSGPEQARALTFLEMQRAAMLMYTSCGWFFADISGIETQQVLKYAGRVMDLQAELGLPSIKSRFLEILAEARSNIPKLGNGADIYRRFVESARVAPERVAAHLGMIGLVDETASGETGAYSYRRTAFQKQEHGRLTLATEHLELEANSTGKLFSYALASMHFGDVDFYSVLKPFPGEESFQHAVERLWERFRAGSLPSILRLAQEEFGPEEYGLEHLLPTGRERISELLFGQMVERFAAECELLFKANRRNIEMLQEAGFELPMELRAAAEFTVGRRFEEEIRRQGQSNDVAAYRKALEIASGVAQQGLTIDRREVRRTFEEMIARAVRYALAHPAAENFQAALAPLTLARKLNLEADLERAQEYIYEALKKGAPMTEEIRELAITLGFAPGLLQRLEFKTTDAVSHAPDAEAALP